MCKVGGKNYKLECETIFAGADHFVAVGEADGGCGVAGSYTNLSQDEPRPLYFALTMGQGMAPVRRASAPETILEMVDS